MVRTGAAASFAVARIVPCCFRLSLSLSMAPVHIFGGSYHSRHSVMAAKPPCEPPARKRLAANGTVCLQCIRADDPSGACTLDVDLIVQDFDREEDTFLYPFNAARNRALMLAQTEVGGAEVDCMKEGCALLD